MKIQHQVMIAFTALFAVLGLLMGVAKYNIDQGEYYAGRCVEASNAARSLAEMVRTSPETLAPFQQGVFHQFIPAPLRRSLAEGIVQRVYGLAAGRLLFDSEEVADLALVAHPRVLEEDRVEVESRGDRLTAQARVVDSAGKVLGVLGVELAMNWREFYQREFGLFVAIVVSSVGFGLVVSSLLGLFLSRQLQALGAGVALDKRPAAAVEKIWPIREISDLDNSFSTLRSVFGGFESRMERIIHGRDDLVQQRTLARAYTHLFVGRRFLVRGRWKVLGRMVGVAPGHFFTIQEGEDATRYVVGEVGGVAGPVDGMSAGEAAAWFLRRTVHEYVFQDWIDNLAVHFPLRQGVALELNYSSMKDPTVCLFHEERKKWEGLQVKAGKKVRVLHTMGDKCLREIMLFIAHYGHLPAEELSAEIEKSFGRFYQGALILIRLTDE